MTTDIDIWPVTSAPFKLSTLSSKKSEDPKAISVTPKDCCGNYTLPRVDKRIYRELSIHAIGMNASTWREVMKEHRSTKNLTKVVLDNLKETFGYESGQVAPNGDWSSWTMDQKLVSYRLQDWVHFQTSFEVRSPTGDYRIDRGWFPKVVTQDLMRQKMDVHLPRPGYSKENFEEIWQVFKFLLQDFPSKQVIILLDTDNPIRSFRAINIRL